MLKIKDNIPLAELEKFGFKGCDTSYSVFVGSATINVLTYNRTIYIHPNNIWNVADDCLGLLYDLIKADMVEKVEN